MTTGLHNTFLPAELNGKAISGNIQTISNHLSGKLRNGKRSHFHTHKSELFSRSFLSKNSNKLVEYRTKYKVRC